MRGVAPAVDCVRRALAAGEPIAIHGDYDVDGVAAAAVLTLTLRRLGAAPLVYIPHRVRDGYGLSPGAVRELAQQGARVILTVDCGITANAEVELASSLGVDVVVTDHHHVPTELPAARAVMNPRQPGCSYGFRELSGTGVAYVLARALLSRALPGPAADAAADDLLDLVALGTVADLVPLVGENRTLVARGLRVLNAARRPAIRALLARAGLRPGKITAQQVGIKIAPPLNAAGRMGEAADAFALLIADDSAEAEALAVRLGGLNRDRQQAVSAALDAARVRVDPDAAATVLAGEFPSGIAGLVAGRLADESGRPTVVLERGDEVCKGSARSPDGFHLVQALDRCADLLLKFGGHAQAAGLTLRTANLPAFEARFRQLAADALDGGPPAPRWRVDGETTLRAVNWAFAEALQVLEPYGMGNPLPLFLNRRAQVRAV